MNISDKILKATGGKAYLPAPNPDKPAQWRRMDCPFCDTYGTRRQSKKANGTINYQYDCFRCHRCGMKFNGDRYNKKRRQGDIRDKRYPESATKDTVTFKRSQELFDYYAPVITMAIKYVNRKIGRWGKGFWLNAKALELLWEYAEGDPLGPNDSGMLERWEIAANGDQQKLFRYVGAALKSDLFNYATSEIKGARHTGVSNVPEWVEKGGGGWESVTSVVNPLVEDGDTNTLLEDLNAADGPADRSAGNENDPLGNVSTDEIYVMLVDNDDAKFSSWGRKCEVTRNGGAPVMGHCSHCDAKLRSHRVVTLEEWLYHHGGLAYVHWLIPDEWNDPKDKDFKKEKEEQEKDWEETVIEEESRKDKFKSIKDQRTKVAEDATVCSVLDKDLRQNSLTCTYAPSPMHVRSYIVVGVVKYLYPHVLSHVRSRLLTS